MNLRTYVQAGTAVVLATSLTAYPVVPGRSAEGPVASAVAVAPVYHGDGVLPKQLNVARPQYRVLSRAMDAKKSISFDPGIEAACSDLSLDPNIEAPTKDLSIDPKMVNRMGSADGNNSVLIDPSIIGDGAKLRSELSTPLVAPPAAK